MTTAFDDLVREVRSVMRGYGLVQEGVAFLSSSINATALTITVTDATALSPGLVEIDSEVIYIQSISSNTLTVAPDGRGWDGTTAATHASSARVTANPPYPTWRLERALNDSIVGVFPDVFGVASTSFTYNPSVTTYSIPADAEDILKVTTTVLGPSMEQVEIHRYSFNSNAPTTEFATGNCLTLSEAPDPGRTVTVTYMKAPSELASGDDFIDSGLRETARPAVVYAAVARLLSFVDATRTLVDSAVGAEFGADQRVGTATQLAAQMSARYQMELDKEQARLRKAHPPRVRFTR
jgi:hypothetical protein